MRIHDPHHVAHLAATILSSRPDPEAHHVKAAVQSARAVLDEAHRMVAEDEARADAAPDSADASNAQSAAPAAGAAGDKTAGTGTENQQ